MSEKVIDGRSIYDSARDLKTTIPLLWREVYDNEGYVIRFTAGRGTEVTIAVDSNLIRIHETLIVFGAYDNRKRIAANNKIGPYFREFSFEPSQARTCPPKHKDEQPVLAYQIQEEGWFSGLRLIKSGRLTDVTDWYAWPGDWIWMNPATEEVDICTDEEFRRKWAV